MSLLALLIGIAVGKLFGYEGNVIVMADGSEFCNSGILAYDTFRPGLRVDGTDLDPFCVDVDHFAAQYRPNGEAESFSADVHYSDAAQIADGAPPTPGTVEVNEPLRFDGERVYLLGHGYAPEFTVTFPDGSQRTQAIQWEPVDQTTFLSQGATKFDRPGVTTDAGRRATQLAITGLFAPTSSGGGIVTSTYPALTNPEVAADVLPRRPRAGLRTRPVDLRDRPVDGRPGPTRARRPAEPRPRPDDRPSTTGRGSGSTPSRSG